MLIHSQREPVRAAILYSLEHYCHESAVFLAERLYDEVGDVESLYLLATCLYHSRRLQQARHLLSKLRPSCHAPSNLLHATICLDLDE
ncbi:Cell division cycle protein 27 homolog [Geodia barretti]|uniref:Cell division cycle protein 27 homolog n=1 Tax=Geodia barretti TaxID=519541 RepID=A0AA35WWX9_GEOBA|nr:Cell division cycle protein 27 homolog [Geodia barretti]